MTNIQTKLETMLTLQNEMNRWVHEDWNSQGFEWYRAVWVEASEMLEHYGWKWWKHQQPDLAQVKLEVIDIVHFCLSMQLETGKSLSEIATAIGNEFNAPRQTDDIRTTIELLAVETLKDQQAHFSIIAGLMHHLQMDFDELYKKYVGKNVLNIFRQDHGYKQGSYIKVWNGREDNEYLEDILGELDIDSDNFRDDIYTSLSRAYPASSQPAG
ncbi:MAG: dUTP diphosphatase [Gammaproteobacteria bacterium]|nr:dUTP diphosphatase [Gammaproteobacteria bacterium]